MRKKKTKTYLRIKLGENIRELRESQDLSLRKLGLMTGVHYSYITSIEKGEANPSIDKIERLAHGLGVEVKDLF